MTIIYFILMLGIIIFVHEFGHLIVAKLFNVYVSEFALGFGPKLWSKKGKETTYSLRAIPLGGFNGMVENEETPLAFDEEGNPTEILRVPKERTLYGVAIWKRILILLAGTFFNLLLAVFVFILIFQINGFINEYPAPYIDSVTSGSPAEIAGLQAGDLITKIEYTNGDVVIPETFYDIIVANQSNTDPMTIYIERAGQEMVYVVTPKLTENNQYLIGISCGPLVQKELTFWSAIPTGIEYTFDTIKLTLSGIVGLFTGRTGLDSLGGTIAIYEYTKEAASYGLVSLLSLMGSLSISVGLMNQLPLAIFDGGKVVMAIIELITGKRMNEKVEMAINYFALAVIMLLFVFVTYQDITKFFG
ncbi:MAG: site-2 protease family protein [Erysipelotrichaceae bacterium]|nr:site-2 protease family protein [Erysipelotrichaceae bacterium]